MCIIALEINLDAIERYDFNLWLGCHLVLFIRLCKTKVNVYAFLIVDSEEIINILSRLFLCCTNTSFKQNNGCFMEIITSKVI